jgi:hypothetical protein
MVEVLVASAFLAGGVMAVARFGNSMRSGHLEPLAQTHGAFFDDLPCPWCQAATSENDVRCPSCHQKFG